jgi:hypothetical protein
MTPQDLDIIFLKNRVAYLTEQVNILKSYIMQRDKIETEAGESQVEQVKQEATCENS